MPVPLFAWNEILDSMRLNTSQRQDWVIALILIHVLGIIIFVAGSIAYRKKLTHLTMILGYLQDKKFKMVSYKRLQDKYPDENISEEYGRKLIRTFPEQVRLAMVKDKQTGKFIPGIARLDQPVDLAPDSPDQD